MNVPPTHTNWLTYPTLAPHASWCLLRWCLTRYESTHIRWPTRATISIPNSAFRTRFGTTSDFQTRFISTFASKLNSDRPSNLIRKPCDFSFRLQPSYLRIRFTNLRLETFKPDSQAFDFSLQTFEFDSQAFDFQTHRRFLNSIA